MKILHVIDSGGFFGAEVMLINLAAAQLKMGLEPAIASVGDPGIGEKAIEIEARNRQVPVQVFRMRPGPNLVGACRLLNFCRDGKFDLIHSHGYKGNILLGPLPGRVKKIPMLSTLHGWITTAASGFTRLRAYEWLDALVLSRFIDRIVLVNRGMLENPRIARLSQRKIFVVDNGIDAAPSLRHMPLEQDIVDFCNDGFVIIAIGRYSLEKGFDILLKTLISLQEKIPNLKLLLIGEGGCRGQYENIIRENNLENRVLLAGYHPEAWRFFTLADLYVISSWTEGLPITLLEAMRSKVPVVATRVGGIPEVLHGEKGGFLVPPGNPQELARMIETCFSNPAMAGEKAEFCYNRFHDHYTSRAMAEKYLAIYRELLS
jgi:glycosyltransferase involved in cell wall biosynthesis